MRLRIRLNKATKVLEVESGSVKLCQLKDIVVASIPGLGKDFQLSLNGRDRLQGDDVELTNFGIVSGDLVHVLCDISDNSDKSLQNGALVSRSVEVSQSSFSGADNTVKSAQNQDKEGSCVIQKDPSDMDVLYRDDDTEPKGVNEVSQSDSEVLQASIKLEQPRSMEELTEIKEYLNEPMLCREATVTAVPNRLVEIFQNECSSSQSEALCGVLHVLMLETGFSPVCNWKCHSRHCMPDGWRCPGSYKLAYTHPASEATFCDLILVPLGSQMMVHGSIKGGDPQSPCKIQLKVQDYIGPLDQDVPKVYSNLAKLSRIFKDTVSLPLLHKIHSAGGKCMHQGFMSIPNEVKLIILKHLDVGSLLNVAEVSKSLNKLAKDPWLWRRNYLLYWPKRGDNSLNQNWYEIYRVEYKQRKELRERLRRMTPVLPHHPFFPRIHPMSGFIPPPPTFGGIIGGEYDLNPNFGFPDPVFPGTGRLIIPEHHPQLLQPRFDPMGPDPDMNICISPNRPRSPQHGGRYGGGRPFFGGMSPRFL